MARHVDCVILGAGTAGLTAYKEASAMADEVLLVDPGPLGTTCARVGCMPSKAFIHAARAYANRAFMAKAGITGTDDLAVDSAAVMAHVRRLRDQFASGPAKATEKLGERYIRGHAHFTGPDQLQIEGETVSAKAIIVATGTRPVVPGPWQALGRERILTSDTIFDLARLPATMAVVGLGPVGAELSQALAQLGVAVHGYAKTAELGGITDPAVLEAAQAGLARHVALHLQGNVTVAAKNGAITMTQAGQQTAVDAVLVAMGRKPNVEHLNLQALGLALNDHGLPNIDPRSLRAGDAPVYFAGDVSGIRPLMHEAADEGRLAAYHGLHPEAPCFGRRTPLTIVFTQPGLATVGQTHRALAADAIIGEYDFANQSRAMMADKAGGLLRIYAQADGRLLGAEMAIPEAEHLAHLLAWAIQSELSVLDALQMPFYHPTLEEGVRSALQDVRRQCRSNVRFPTLPLCGDVVDPALG